MSDKKNIHEGHRARMRKRFREIGFEGFNDHEILEMLLFYTCPRKDTNELAHILLNKFGSISAVLDADYEELVKIKNITENTAILFKMIPKFLPIYYNSRHDGIVYNNSDKLKELFKPYYVGLTHEEFRMACFDNNLHLLSNVLISTGAPSYAPVDTRKIVEEALRTKAASVAISHNHPRSDMLASPEDMNATRQINTILKSLDIMLLDHIIVIENSAASLRQLGHMTLFD